MRVPRGPAAAGCWHQRGLVAVGRTSVGAQPLQQAQLPASRRPWGAGRQALSPLRCFGEVLYSTGFRELRNE